MKELELLFKKICNNISKEDVLKAAKEYPSAKEALQSLFPQYFVEDKSVDVAYKNGEFTVDGDSNRLQRRITGEYRHKSFWLSPLLNWEIKKDSDGQLCLIPTKK